MKIKHEHIRMAMNAWRVLMAKKYRLRKLPKRISSWE